MYKLGTYKDTATCMLKHTNNLSYKHRLEVIMALST